MCKLNFKIPAETKIFNGQTYSAFHTIEVSKEDAIKEATRHRKNGWIVRSVKIAYEDSKMGWVLYGMRKTK